MNDCVIVQSTKIEAYTKAISIHSLSCRWEA